MPCEKPDPIESMTMTFTADQFTPTKWETASDKAAFANRFVRFVQSDFAAKHFTDKFYRRLSNCFGMIAHYNRGGFWSEFFTTTEDKVRFWKDLPMAVLRRSGLDLQRRGAGLAGAGFRLTAPLPGTASNWSKKPRPGSVPSWPGFKQSTGRRLKP